MIWSGSSDDVDVMVVGDTSTPKLTSGTTYYWRVGSTEPMNNPWSNTWSFAIALGAAPAIMSPSPGATNVPVMPTFTWNSAAKATSYEFIPAKDNESTNVVVALTGVDALPTTAWRCDRELDYSTTYFWKVRATSTTSYGEWVTNVFTTEAVTSTTPALQSPPASSLSPEQTPLIPSHLLWAMVGIGVALVIALFVLIIRTRGWSGRRTAEGRATRKWGW